MNIYGLLLGLLLTVSGSITPGAAWCAEASREAALTRFERLLIDLPPNSWHEVPNSRMSDVCAPDSFGVHGSSGCKGIIEAWGGGAYDPAHRKMLIWGGGHNDYWGNEVYGFDLRAGKWERLTDPSPGTSVTSGGGDPLPDGQPNSRHTYDGLQYLTRANRFFGHGGAVSPGGGGTKLVWLFDVDSRRWTRSPGAGGPGGYGIASGYDPASGMVFMRSTKALWAYDPDSNEWAVLNTFGNKPLWPRYEVSGDKRGTVDLKRRLFWSVGNNDLLVWDIAKRRLVTEDWVTTGGGAYSNRRRVKRYPDQVFESGGGDIFNARAPGFDYDAKADQMVAWKGGPAYVLDLASKTWEVKSAAGAPAKQIKAGTFGRWRYLPEYNVFILVNGASSNVFFYKNTAGGPP